MCRNLSVFFKIVAAVIVTGFTVVNSCTMKCRCYHQFAFDLGEDREYLLGSWHYHPFFPNMYELLYTASCSYKNLTELPLGLDLDIKTIILHHNNITQLKNNSFEQIGLTDLRIIYLNNNNISLIEDNAFNGLSELKKLVLDYNNITSLPQNVFEPCLKLRYLSMNGNKLTLPDDNFVNSLSQLQVLRLAYCSIQTLPKELYSKKLTYFDISNNELKNTTMNFSSFALNISYNDGIIFNHKTELTFISLLNLSGNSLNNPDGTSFNAPNLEVLILSSCKITDADIAYLLQHNTEIRILELVNNSLQQLDLSTMQSLRNLQEIYLQKNNITALDKNIFANNSFLSKINLNENPVSLAENMPFLNSSSLEKLFLQYCNITRITEHTFTATMNLQELYLDYNLLETLHDTFHELQHLRIISLAGNRIKLLHPDTFVNNINLDSLILSRNPLDIPEKSYFLSAPPLKEIRLDFCNITRVPVKMFAYMPYLQVINLGNNSFSTLDSEIFQGLKRIFKVEISGNPLICDIRLKKVFHSLIMKDIYSRAQCVVPKGDWRMLEHMHFDEEQEITALSTPAATLAISAASSEGLPPEKGAVSKLVMAILLVVGLLVGVLVGIAVDVFVSRRYNCISLRRGSSWKRILSDRDN